MKFYIAFIGLAFFLVETLPEAEASRTPRGLRPSKKNIQRTPSPDIPPSDSSPSTSPSENSPSEASEDNASSQKVPGVKVTWYGHSFIYLTSTSGVRIAFNPFTEGTLKYHFPKRLPADVVLISCESADHSGSKHFYGLPQVFRSLAGIGRNTANGIPLQGVLTYRDNNRGKDYGKNTSFACTVDNLRFCHLGPIGHNLTSAQRSKLGDIDVLFLPIGNKNLSAAGWIALVKKLKAKWIVPIYYKTPKNNRVNLRSLDELDFSGQGFSIKQVPNNKFHFSQNELPETPTLLLLTSP